jgi:hypothetical protein
MQTIQQAFGLSKDIRAVVPSFLLRQGRVGIEIELEGMYRVSGRDTLHYWSIIGEDSLRDSGIEFVTKGDGWEGSELIEAFKELEEYLKQHSPKATWRCSNHVHLDVRDLTIQQTKRIILASIIVEDVIYKSAGEHRMDSNFCMPLSFAESLIQALSQHWHRDDGDFFYNIRHVWSKYSGVNILPVVTQGTIEFRNSEPKHARGQLLRLCNRYLAIKEVAVKWDALTDNEFIEMFTPKTVEEMFVGCLPRGYMFAPIEELEERKMLARDVVNLAELRNETMVAVREEGEELSLRTANPEGAIQFNGLLPNDRNRPDGLFSVHDITLIRQHLSMSRIRSKLLRESYNYYLEFLGKYPDAGNESFFFS